jgi:hypothetical protein
MHDIPDVRGLEERQSSCLCIYRQYMQRQSVPSIAESLDHYTPIEIGKMLIELPQATGILQMVMQMRSSKL